MTPRLASIRIVLLWMASHPIVSARTPVEWRESIRDDPHVHVRESGSKNASARVSIVDESLWLPFSQEYDVADVTTRPPVGAMNETDTPLEYLLSEEEFATAEAFSDVGGLELSVPDKKRAHRYHGDETAKAKWSNQVKRGGDSKVEAPKGELP